MYDPAAAHLGVNIEVFAVALEVEHGEFGCIWIARPCCRGHCSRTQQRGAGCIGLHYTGQQRHSTGHKAGMSPMISLLQGQPDSI